MLITTYKEANRLQNIATAIVLVACIEKSLCVACIHWPMFTHQNCMQQCVHRQVFEVFDTLNMQAHKCACTDE